MHAHDSITRPQPPKRMSSISGQPSPDDYSGQTGNSSHHPHVHVADCVPGEESRLNNKHSSRSWFQRPMGLGGSTISRSSCEANTSGRRFNRALCWKCPWHLLSFPSVSSISSGTWRCGTRFDIVRNKCQPLTFQARRKGKSSDSEVYEQGRLLIINSSWFCNEAKNAFFLKRLLSGMSFWRSSVYGTRCRMLFRSFALAIGFV